MAPLKLLAFLSIPLLALTSPVEDYLALKPRAASSQAASTPTPTGPYCVGSATAKPVTTKEIESAVAGCVGVQAIGTNDTRNDIVDGICKPITLIFARGTGEDPNLGNIVGPPLVDALNATFGTKHVAVQGVNHYPATDIGFCEGGSASGAHNLAYLIRRTESQCPKTKLIVSGYSQGAQVVHDGIEQLSASETAFITAVVLFGDPDQIYPVGGVPADDVSRVCHKGDIICHGGEVVKKPHLTYCHDVAKEVAFIKARVDG